MKVGQVKHYKRIATGKGMSNMSEVNDYIDKDCMLDYVKIVDNYNMTDVLWAFNDGRFDEYPRKFIMYIWKIINKPTSKRLAGIFQGDTEGESKRIRVGEDIDKDLYSKKVLECLPAITKVLAFDCARLMKTKTGKNYLAKMELIEIRKEITKHCVNGESPEKVMNQTLRVFEQGYKKGMGKNFNEDDKELLEDVYDAFYNKEYA